MSNLRALEPYSGLFILLSLVFATAGLFVIRKRKNTQVCSSQDYCSSSRADRVRQILLWFSVGLVALALAWPNLLPIILGPMQ